jgi:hypothetical protein
MSSTPANYLDALHGEVELDERIAKLAASPVVQRLRHVRLSNIDSLSMPGIANLSRYEHVLGVAYLASRMGLRRRISELDHLALMAAALLHDWAITAFGHLVEEAFQYLSINFHHENKLDLLLHGERDGDTLGTELQILAGRQTGLPGWARNVAGSAGDDLLERIGALIQGDGPLGQLVCGEMDLDNIDNVYRIAFHMGLEVDRALPVRLVEAIVAMDDTGLPVFKKSAASDVAAWIETRRKVYSHLMPARPDFGLKLMIIWATIQQIEAGKFTKDDWTVVDTDFISRLSAPDAAAGARDTIVRWITGEIWDITPLWWLPGTRPSYAELADFSKELTTVLSRHCFAYGIKDKRERQLHLTFDDGSSAAFGTKPRTWLFGVGSSRRGAFSRAETEAIVAMATERFAPATQAVPAQDPMVATREACLL